jgi:thymidylate synthase ThyX
MSQAVVSDFQWSLMYFYSRVERHSITPTGEELLSFVVTYPRSVLCEFNTHTVISKNTSSSRAIPYSRKSGERKPTQPPSMREMVLENPYLPIFWSRNEAGMQATKELDSKEIVDCKSQILELRNEAIKRCDTLWCLGLAKQDLNRYLEPWSWTTQILTGTQWANFFALRTHKDAHPAFRKVARRMYLQYRASVPTRLDYGEWHLPFIDDQDRNTFVLEDLKRVSVARCARLSYNTFDGLRDSSKDFELYEKLAGGWPKHMSPFGHQGKPQRLISWSGNFLGWHQLRKDIVGENITVFSPSEAELVQWMAEDC